MLFEDTGLTSFFESKTYTQHTHNDNRLIYTKSPSSALMGTCILDTPY